MKLQTLIEQTMNEHEVRLDVCDTVPLERKPPTRLTPKTAMIAEAAKVSAAKKKRRKYRTAAMRATSSLGVSA